MSYPWVKLSLPISGEKRAGALRARWGGASNQPGWRRAARIRRVREENFRGAVGSGTKEPVSENGTGVPHGLASKHFPPIEVQRQESASLRGGSLGGVGSGVRAQRGVFSEGRQPPGVVFNGGESTRSGRAEISLSPSASVKYSPPAGYAPAFPLLAVRVPLQRGGRPTLSSSVAWPAPVPRSVPALGLASRSPGTL